MRNRDVTDPGSAQSPRPRFKTTLEWYTGELRKQPSQLPEWMKHLAEIIVIASLYVLTGKFGFMLAMPPGNVTTVWIPSGIALAAILLRGYRVWPGIWLGAFLVNSWFFTEQGSSVFITFLMASNIAVGSLLQATLGARLIQHWIKPSRFFDTTDGMFRFFGIEILACIVAPTFGVGTLIMGGFVEVASFGYTWWSWWLGDLIGVLVITPLLLAWSQPPSARWTSRHIWEALVMAVLLAAFGHIVFSQETGDTPIIDPLAFMLLPFTVWAAYRFGPRGVTLAIFAISIMAIQGTIQGSGPFVRGTLNDSLSLLQTFVGTLTMTGLILSAAVTQSRRREDELGELAAIVESSDDAIVGKTLDGIVVSWNKGAELTYGYSAGEILGKSVSLLVPPERSAELSAFLKKVGRGERVQRHETIRVRKDGAPIDVSLTISPIKDRDGRIVGVSSIARDITMRRRNEEALRQSEERFRAFMDNSPAIAFIKDVAGRYLYANGTFLNIFGRSLDELKEKTDYDVWPEETAKQLRENDVAVLNANKTIQMFETIPTPDGVPHHWMVYKFPILHILGHRYLGGVAVDITERRKLEAAREQLRSQYEAAVEKIKMLAGFLPICASCKKIRDDQGYWKQVEEYISEHTAAEFSHSICPECTDKLYPELKLGKKKPTRL